MRPGWFRRTKSFPAIFRKMDALTEVIEIHSSRFCDSSRQFADPGLSFPAATPGRYAGIWFSRSKLLTHFSKNSLREYELANSSTTRLTLTLLRTANLKSFKRT